MTGGRFKCPAHATSHVSASKLHGASKRLTGGEGLPLVPVSFLSPGSLLVLLLVAILLSVPTCRLGAAESPAQGEDCEQESSGQDGVVEEEGRVQRDVVRASAREHCPSIALLLLLDPVDVDRGGGHEAQQGQEEEQCE